MERNYLVRYGMARLVGRFAGLEKFARGQPVVVRTHRGTEMGEVLAEALPSPDCETPIAPILRAAGAGDLERARSAGLDRTAHFEALRAVFAEGDWPIEIIDAEPLLDPARTVLHYLGHRIDISGLVDILRGRLGLDVVLEPAGRAVDPEPEPESHGCGSCGSSGGCGEGGCGTGSGGCAVKAIIAARRRVPVDA